jgi:ABC-2 type transport system permease protein
MLQSTTSEAPAVTRATSGIPYYLRVLHVVGAIDFKARYTDAALGYVWSVVKPLAYLGVLWLVFAHLLRTANQTDDFTLYLLIGLLLFLFFVDSVSIILPSIVQGGMTLRRLAFDPILIPLSASVAIGITFLLNVSAFCSRLGFALAVGLAQATAPTVLRPVGPPPRAAGRC